MAREFGNDPKHPEGLTPAQEELADLLCTTKILAKVRRRELLNGEFNFYEIIRDTSPIDFPVDPGEFALKLHEKKPDAPLSPIYINLRNLPTGLLSKIGQAMSEQRVTEERPDFCVGIPSAGIPLADHFSNASHIPTENIFEKSDTGSQRRIVPAKNAKMGFGRKLYLIDDLVTGADTKLEAIKVAEELDWKIVGIGVLVDREQGGVTQLKEAGYHTNAVFTLLQLLGYYHRTEKIDTAKYQEAKNYLATQQKV